MAFQFKKISDVGTSHPIVARLGVQTSELVHWTGLDKRQQDEIAELYIYTLSQRLLRCDKAAETIQNRMEEDIERIQSTKNQGTGMQVPYVTELEGLAEQFLYDAKNYLRDLLGIFRIAYGRSLKDASDFADLKGKGESVVVQWATDTFGPEDGLVRMLKTEQDWTTELIRKRNAVEHPDGKSGKLYVHNIRVHKGVLMPPCWNRTDLPESSILADMAGYNNNLLTLAENLLVDVVLRTKRSEQIAIYEIPEAGRRPASPVRLQIGLDPEFAAKIGRKRTP